MRTAGRGLRAGGAGPGTDRRAGPSEAARPPGRTCLGRGRESARVALAQARANDTRAARSVSVTAAAAVQPPQLVVPLPLTPLRKHQCGLPAGAPTCASARPRRRAPALGRLFPAVWVTPGSSRTAAPQRNPTSTSVTRSVPVTLQFSLVLISSVTGTFSWRPFMHRHEFRSLPLAWKGSGLCPARSFLHSIDLECSLLRSRNYRKPSARAEQYLFL